MDASGTSKGKGVIRKSDKTRRVFSTKEEHVLIAALKDIVIKGWRCENGFKTGYLALLEQFMVKAFPGTDIRGDPHINSKIHVWKKNHASLVTMLSRSGFGWNDGLNMIEVEDSVWENYVKTDSNARTMRHKSWPFYQDWCEIFGRDRATGEQAEDLNDAVLDLQICTKRREFEGEYTPFNLGSDTDNDFLPETKSPNSVSGRRTSGAAKRSKSNTGSDERIIDMMASLVEKADARLEVLASRLGYEHDAATARKAVYEALGKIPGLGLRDKLNAADHLVKNKEKIDLFFSLPAEDRAEYVQIILGSQD